LIGSFEVDIPLGEIDSPFSLIYISLRIIMNRRNRNRNMARVLGVMMAGVLVISIVKLIPIDWLRTTLIVLATVVTFIYGSFYISKKD
jgi:hypothetical protein